MHNFIFFTLSSDFYFYSTLFYLFFSILPFLMLWAGSEKAEPFYFQRDFAYMYMVFTLSVGIFLMIKNGFYCDVVYSNVEADFLKNIKSVHLLSQLNIDNTIDSFFGLVSNSFFINYSRIAVLLFSLIAIVMSKHYLSSIRYNYFEFYIFILFSTLAMIVLVSSRNVLLTYLAIELQSLSIYLLSSSQRKSIHSIEAGLKYMFIGSLASGALLIGFSFVYILTGSLDFFEIRLVFQGIIESMNFLTGLPDEYVVSMMEPTHNPVDFSLSYPNASDMMIYIFFLSTYYTLFIFAGPVLIIFSLLVKIAVAPFHLWLADVYEGAPTSVTIYFLLVPKIAILTVFYRLMHEVFCWNSTALIPSQFSDIFQSRYVSLIFIFLVIYSFIVGYSGILNKKINLKRFFAFSSIGHLGFIFFPYTVGFSTDIFSYSILYTISMYFIIYLLITIPSIKTISLFSTPKIEYSVGRKSHYLIENLPSSFHIVSPANSVFIFSLFITFVGIPPTAGFFMKLYPLLINAIMPNILVFFVWPVIVLSAYVYVRILVSLFFSDFNIYNPRNWVIINTTDTYLSTWLSVFSLVYLFLYTFQSAIIEYISLDLIIT